MKTLIEMQKELQDNINNAAAESVRYRIWEKAQDCKLTSVTVVAKMTAGYEIYGKNNLKLPVIKPDGSNSNAEIEKVYQILMGLEFFKGCLVVCLDDSLIIHLPPFSSGVLMF